LEGRYDGDIWGEIVRERRGANHRGVTNEMRFRLGMDSVP
jgi:hypothetical protein